MTCPKCRERLVREQYRLRNYLLCFYCEGAWLGRADIAEHGIIDSFDAFTTTSHLCPCCEPQRCLERINIQGVELEWCKNCGGMFFDKNELEAFAANYKDVDAKSLVTDASIAALTLLAIARTISSVLRLFMR